VTRVNLVLLLAVIFSAIYLVNVQYESRRLFTELDKAQAEERRLSSELDRLQVEKRGQATSARVEKLAREKLQMRLVLPAITTYVSYDQAGAAPAAKTASPQSPAMSTVAAAPGAKP
jgi:cell division protein FtsL